MAGRIDLAARSGFRGGIVGHPVDGKRSTAAPGERPPGAAKEDGK